jgi:thioesterase domain-containing protein
VEQLEKFGKDYKETLLKSIPVVAAMDVDISHIEDSSLVLTAPLTKNINYEGTAFGGSLNTLGILSCYLLVHHLLKIHEIPFTSLVIQDSSIQYLKPVNGDFCSQSVCINEEKFLRMMKRRGTGRAEMEAEIFTVDEKGKTTPFVSFKGRFVAS